MVTVGGPRSNETLLGEVEGETRHFEMVGHDAEVGLADASESTEEIHLTEGKPRV